MCGIVGYIGSKPVVPILLDGLAKLEYRGYDSAGIAVLTEQGIEVEKSVGKLAVLAEKLAQHAPRGTLGIGHTRWATHGRPSDINSHPHTDCAKKFAVVHNGIIENFQKLKEWLSANGHTFRSETDTEVLPHLVEHFYQGDLLAAVREVVRHIEGSYALGIICEDEPDKIVAVRKDSPLVVGLGQGENFIASDIPAILSHTRDTYILNDGEMVLLTAAEVKVFDQQGQEINKEVFRVHWDVEAAEKGGYPHFMLKEIHEQPKALRDTLSGRLATDNSRVLLEELQLTSDEVKQIKKVFITACGTAYHAGIVGKYVIEDLARIPVEVDIASEFRYRNPIIDQDTLVVVISQSGETADTLAALREAKNRGARVLAVTNVVGSSVAREADWVIYTWAGPEIAVASTKAYTTQLVVMYLLGLYLAQQRGTLAAEQIREVVSALRDLPQQVEAILGREEEIKGFVQKYAHCEDVFFLGRSIDYAVAMEGSLKLKEISYIHAEAYAAGELKHGTLALIVEGILVLALATQMDVFDKMVSNIKEVKARDAAVVGITFEGEEELAKSVDEVIYIPRTHKLTSAVLTVVPLQLIAYYVAVARGCDVDKQRNLAKSVTVE